MSASIKRRTTKKNRLSETTSPRGYERGLEIADIVGVTDYTGELMYLIKWENCEDLDLLPATEVNEKSPQSVISFNEKRCPLNKKAKLRAAVNVPIAIPACGNDEISIERLSSSSPAAEVSQMDVDEVPQKEEAVED